jgi:hypothetical protein
MLKYRHSEAPFKMIKVSSGKVPVKVIDDQAFLYLQKYTRMIKYFNFISGLWSDLA